jgi:hypothetical protein
VYTWVAYTHPVGWSQPHLQTAAKVCRQYTCAEATLRCVYVSRADILYVLQTLASAVSLYSIVLEARCRHIQGTIVLEARRRHIQGTIVLEARRRHIQGTPALSDNRGHCCLDN